MTQSRNFDSACRPQRKVWLLKSKVSLNPETRQHSRNAQNSIPWNHRCRWSTSSISAAGVLKPKPRFSHAFDPFHGFIAPSCSVLWQLSASTLTKRQKMAYVLDRAVRLHLSDAPISRTGQKLNRRRGLGSSSGAPSTPILGPAHLEKQSSISGAAHIHILTSIHKSTCF